MTLPALAEASDLAERIGGLSDAQAERAPALLADASAKVRAYCDRTFTLVEADLVNLRTRGGRITLPRSPVVAIDSVATVDGTAIPATAWSWDGLDLITVQYCYAAPTMQVVYSHGDADVPGVVLAKVCEMVLRVLAAPTATDGLSAETIGQYSYQQAGGSAGVAARLTRADKDDLRDAGLGPRSAGTITLRSW